ncbi:MAG: alpha/beta fold hydrolase [Nitriliruptorales bacterium]
MSFPAGRRVALAAGAGARGTPLDPVSLAVHERGEGPAVVLLHGFPELAYSWRHQLPALAAAGFRAVAPDQRGYGDSDAPEPVEAYDLEQLTGDAVRLLDALGIERAVFVGHDWGGFVAWALPLLHPGRVAGVAGVNTPNMPFPPTALLRRLVERDEQLYILWFQEPRVAESVLDRHVEAVFDKVVRRGRPGTPTLGRGATAGDRSALDFNVFRDIADAAPLGPELLTDEELARYTAAFERSGFRGGINWYRNIDRNAERFPRIGEDPIEVPALMITAEWDPALPPSLADGMGETCSDLETHLVRGCGHWTQQERPDEVNAVLVDWLRRRFG